MQNNASIIYGLSTELQVATFVRAFRCKSSQAPGFPLQSRSLWAEEYISTAQMQAV
jgi:hypothetical protein